MLGICHVPVAPMMSSPCLKAEMVSQLLAGEQVEILDSEGSWFLVMNLYDEFKGWVDSKMIELLIEGQDTDITRSCAGLVSAPLLCAHDQYGRSFYLPGGSRLYTHGSSIAIAPGRNLEMEVREHLVQPILKSRKKLVSTALSYNGAPFLWGGRTVFGIDCTGLVQMVFLLNGIKIPRKIDQQMETGVVAGMIEESAQGDVAFFEGPEGNIIHAGIIADKDRIIHGYGEVRIDLVDNEGIFNKHTRQYSHKLRVIKRFIP